jgi:hypothetical protein
VIAVAFQSSNVHLHEYLPVPQPPLQLAIDLNMPLDETHGDLAIPYEKGVKTPQQLNRLERRLAIYWA